jgi:hypothetical protein
MEAGLVAVEEREGRVWAGESFEGEGQSAALLESVPRFGDTLALAFHFEIEQGGLDAGVAGQTPMRGGELADQIGLGLVGGSEVLKVVAKFGLIFFLRLVGKDDGFRSKAVLDSVKRDSAAALLSFGAARFRSIDAGCFGSGRGHILPGESLYLGKV